MEPVLLVFTPELTPRIRYIFALFFESLIHTSYKLTKDIGEYKRYAGPKLNYSEQSVQKDKVFIQSSGLLSQVGINVQDIKVAEWNGLKIFYQVKQGNLPFDVFAAAFYLVSRYEEYLESSRDEHDRFKAANSLAFKNKFLDIPIVNLWAYEVKKIILKEYPQMIVKGNQYSFVPTIDVDVAYAHLGRKLNVAIGAYLKLLSKFDFPAIANKTRVLMSLKSDEYDTYKYQEEIFKKHNIRPIYFFLAAKRSAYDKNIATDSKPFVELVKKIGSFADIGIHPSYYSASKPKLVEEEIKKVEKCSPSKITKSRQHFLRVALPDTYRCLAELKVTDDYSLAYADMPGFRAGTCTPFWFYDLPEEKTLPVKVHSTVIMDGTFNEYQHVSPNEATIVIQKLIRQVRNCGGEFISIWHNQSLNEEQHWKGWRRVFEAMIETA